MIQTLEAVIDQNGNVHLTKSVKLFASRRALVTILDEDPIMPISETARMSEPALAGDWLRPEEDEAWSHLQQAQ